MKPLPRVHPAPSAADRLDAVEAKLDEISKQLQVLVEAQRPVVELREEVGAMAGDVMRTSIDQLAFMEERGYFAFLREFKYLLDRLVEDYDPADLHALADNAANILDTVRTVTQAPVMAAVRDAAQAFTDGKERPPVGVLGVLRAVRSDKNVQRGLAFGLDVLGRVGRAVSRAPRMSRKALSPVDQPGPRRKASVETPKSASTPTPAVSPGCEFVPDETWDDAFAETTAVELGVPELTADHLDLVRQVRAEFAHSGSTPNIRKITAISGLSTRQIYTLFPRAPGKTIARIAGVPNPVGCL